MIALGHGGAGALIGAGVASGLGAVGAEAGLVVAVAALAGWASHYLGDWIPHGHYGFNFHAPSLKQIGYLALDIGLALSLPLLAYLGGGETLMILAIAAGVLGALAPDVWEGLIKLGLVPNGRWVRAHTHFHHLTLHWHNLTQDGESRGRPLGVSDVWQLLVFLAAVVVVL